MRLPFTTTSVIFSIFCALSLCRFAAAADPVPHLIADLDTQLRGLAPKELTIVNGSNLVFSGYEKHLGRELWSLELSPFATPTNLNDIWMGLPSSDPEELTSIGSNIIFSAEDIFYGRELRVTNGTTLSTIDINPSGSSNPNHLFEFGGNVFFQATDSGGDTELWVTDGTAPGTTLYNNTELNASGSSAPGSFLEFGSNLYFFAYSSTGDLKLWKTDGSGSTPPTPFSWAGTGAFIDSHVRTAVGPTKFFFVDNNNLFYSDGIGVTLVDSFSNDGGLVFDQLLDPIPVGTGVVIGVKYQNGANSSYQLFFNDALGGSTVKIHSSIGTHQGEYTMPGSFYDTARGPSYVVLGSQTVFRAHVNSNTNPSAHELWVTDGTLSGTKLLLNPKSIDVDGDTVPDGQEALIEGLVPYGGSAYFGVRFRSFTNRYPDESHILTLFKTGGTVATTKRVESSTIANFEIHDRPIVYGSDLLFVTSPSD
ncbi:MAG: hypothetical protein KDD60_08890, partial [Bdellovibrionales bacterium]|nr:hypothetical protein [Bdellovibrionales bacterium]